MKMLVDKQLFDWVEQLKEESPSTYEAMSSPDYDTTKPPPFSILPPWSQGKFMMHSEIAAMKQDNAQRKNIVTEGEFHESRAEYFN